MNQIIIEAVSNGFVVTLAMGYGGSPVPVDFVEMGAKLKKGFHGDDLLNEIERENGLPETGFNVNSNVFVFGTFPEVLAFLKVKYS